MQTQTKSKDFLTSWRDLVGEITEIEELIADSRNPDDTQALWSLHLLQAQLKVKRQQLKEYLHPKQYSRACAPGSRRL